MSDQIEDHLFKLRTISYFLSEAPESDEEWEQEIRKAAAFLQDAAEEMEAQGYIVQTLRIVTRALELTSALHAEAKALHLAHVLEALTTLNDLEFLNLGTSSAEWLLEGTLTSLATTLSNTSFSFSWREDMGIAEARKLAKVILDIGLQTQGSGNFRFGVAFNCPSGIPYFPAAHPGQQSGFAIGTENSGLLQKAMKAAAQRVCLPQSKTSVSQGVSECVKSVFEEALKPVENAASALSSRTGVPYFGIDSSVAPALEGPDITESYGLLNLGSFGSSGTIAISEGITKGLKSLDLKLTGFSGLMLPVMEDAGLAEAAANGTINWQTLLFNSTVCGVGLDTVPIPGIAEDTSKEEAEVLVSKVAGILLDVAAISSRLNKPLLVRLLPVPGAKAGDYTAFCSPYLVESRAMKL